METENRVCENCKFYFQHYFIWRARYRKAGCGHCINRKKPVRACELWEDISGQEEERKKSVEETLMLMSKRLNEIAMILIDIK